VAGQHDPNYFFGAFICASVCGIVPALLASAVAFLRSSRVVVEVAAFSFGDCWPAASALGPVPVPAI